LDVQFAIGNGFRNEFGKLYRKLSAEVRCCTWNEL